MKKFLLIMAGVAVIVAIAMVGNNLLAVPKIGFGQVEIVRQEAGRLIVARLLVTMGFPLKNMANWIYFLQGKDGVVIWDTGTRYPLVTLLGSFFHHSSRCANSRLSPLPVGEQILAALEDFFPGQKVIMLGLSHWHWDHAENAWWLAQRLNAPIRIHSADKAKASLVFAEACAPVGTWQWGADFQTGEELAGTGFKVLATPGHTPGDVSLINEKQKMVITGPSYIHGWETTRGSEIGFDFYSLHPNFDRLANK